MLRAVVVCTYTGNIAANQSVTAITSSDRHCTHGRADGVLGDGHLHPMTSAMRAIGHRLMQPGFFLSGGARTDVIAPAVCT